MPGPFCVEILIASEGGNEKDERCEHGAERDQNLISHIQILAFLLLNSSVPVVSD